MALSRPPWASSGGPRRRGESLTDNWVFPATLRRRLASKSSEERAREISARLVRISSHEDLAAQRCHVVVLRHASEVAPTFPARVARGLGALVFAFGALALVYGRLGRPTHDGGLKGNVSWSVVAKRGDRTWTISEGERLRR